MSAREELIESLLPLYRSQYAPGEEESAIALVDAYAHELAEKIRKGYEGDGPDEDNWIMTPYDAASIIDPEVKR